MFEIREIIDLAIQIERNGEKIYRNALKRVSDPSIYALIQRLADEEDKHVEWFTELKKKIRPGAGDPQLEEIGQSILNSVLGDQAFSLKDVDFSGIDRVDDLLKLAIEFEKDTILFYEMIFPLLGDTEAVEHLKKIIQEENQHVQLFQKLLDEGEAG